MSFFGRLGNLARGAIRQSQLPDLPEEEPPPTPRSVRPSAAHLPQQTTSPPPPVAPPDPTLPRKRTL